MASKVVRLLAGGAALAMPLYVQAQGLQSIPLLARLAEAHASHTAVTGRVAGLLHETLRERWSRGLDPIEREQGPGTFQAYVTGASLDGQLPVQAYSKRNYEQRTVTVGLERMTEGGWWLGGLIGDGEGESEPPQASGGESIEEEAFVASLYARHSGRDQPYSWLLYATASDHDIQGTFSPPSAPYAKYERDAYSAGVELAVEAFRAEQALTPGVTGETALQPAVALIYQDVADTELLEGLSTPANATPLELEHYSRLQGRVSLRLEHTVPVAGWRLRGSATGGVRTAFDGAGFVDEAPVIRDSVGNEITGAKPDLDSFFYRLGLAARGGAEDPQARGSIDLQLQYLGGEETGWQGSLGIRF